MWFKAVKLGQLDVIHGLLNPSMAPHQLMFLDDDSQGADVDMRDENGDTALIIASAVGNVVLVRYLHEAGASVASRNRTGWTALHLACYQGCEPVVKYLLAVGQCDLEECNGHGSTALMVAVPRNHGDVVRLLLRKGASVSVMLLTADYLIRVSVVMVLHVPRP